jgi:hypothetical protein
MRGRAPRGWAVRAAPLEELRSLTRASGVVQLFPGTAASSSNGRAPHRYDVMLGEAMPNTRLVGVFDTTILSVTLIAREGRRTTYEVAVIVNGESHVVRVAFDDAHPTWYFNGGGFDKAFPWAREAVAVIGSWAMRVHKGEVLELPVHVLI